MDVLTDALLVLPKYTDDPWNPSVGLGSNVGEATATAAMDIRYGVVWPNNNHIIWGICKESIL